MYNSGNFVSLIVKIVQHKIGSLIYVVIVIEFMLDSVHNCSVSRRVSSISSTNIFHVNGPYSAQVL
jgi:hypothetical protein